MFTISDITPAAIRSEYAEQLANILPAARRRARHNSTLFMQLVDEYVYALAEDIALDYGIDFDESTAAALAEMIEGIITE